MHLSRSPWQGAFFVLLTLTACSPVRQTAAPAGLPTSTLIAATNAPTPERTPLGEPPQDCPPSDIPETEIPHFNRVAGRAPLWTPILRPGANEIMINIGHSTYTEHGWEYKLLWLMEASYTQSVVITGGSLDDDTPLWFDIQGETISTEPVIDAMHPPIPPQYSHTVEFPSYVFIPKAGCYFLQASWPEGNWRLTFAAGR